jgi:hypothetical protein
MHRTLIAFVVLAVILVPVGRADMPQKLTPAEVKTVDEQVDSVMQGFNTVFHSRIVVSEACPVASGAPGQAKASYKKIVTVFENGTQRHVGPLDELIDEVNGWLKRADAYDVGDQAALTDGVNDMAFGMRIRAGAILQYVDALKKAKAFACGSFNSLAGEIPGLLKQSNARYNRGFLKLHELASGTG